MAKTLFLLNAALTLSFGAAAVVLPALVFAPFGIQLEAGGEAVARGYAATLLGYGLALYLLRDLAAGPAAKALLLSLIVFNGVETVIQAMAGAQGAATGMIYVTGTLHAVLAVACLIAYRRLA